MPLYIRMRAWISSYKKVEKWKSEKVGFNFASLASAETPHNNTPRSHPNCHPQLNLQALQASTSRLDWAGIFFLRLGFFASSLIYHILLSNHASSTYTSSRNNTPSRPMQQTQNGDEHYQQQRSRKQCTSTNTRTPYTTADSASDGWWEAMVVSRVPMAYKGSCSVEVSPLLSNTQKQNQLLACNLPHLHRYWPCFLRLGYFETRRGIWEGEGMVTGSSFSCFSSNV